jgi:geranylgeranyl diphosphate synthase, type II
MRGRGEIRPVCEQAHLNELNARMSLHASIESLNADLERARGKVNEWLEKNTRLEGDCPGRLRDAIRYCLLGSGKRLRPVLVMMAARACGGDTEAALPAACAVEMIHTYSLVHDDLPAMDDDQLRRGQPTVHIKFDEATAILAGDALIPMAFETLCLHYSPPVAARCCLELAVAAGASRLVGGQVDDLAQEKNRTSGQRTESDGQECFSREQSGLEQLEHIHKRKTGAMISVALRLGGIVAEASEVQLASLQEYGDNLGLAFQIVDDLLDYRGDWIKMGKLAGKDFGRGKLTYPGLLGVEPSEARASELIERAIRSINGLGVSAEPLVSLAKFVLERNQ